MVFLSRKRPPAPLPSSLVPPRIPRPQSGSAVEAGDAAETMARILAEAGCTLMNLSGPPCLPSDLHAFRRHLTLRFTSCTVNGDDREKAEALRSDFIAGFSSHIQSPINLRRVLSSSTSYRNDSLVRNLLLVPHIQLDLLEMLLEKLPEYFDVAPGTSLENDVARLIINHFRWLDFIVDPDAFTDKLMQVLSICPLHLKKEIIGSLPEIIGDQNCKAVVDSLEQMLHEDSTIVVPVLDSFSNLSLDDQLQEQAITVALSCIRTIDAEHMPYLLRFLLLAATPANTRRIIFQIREQLRFTGMSKPQASNKKLKGKLPLDNTEASILHALRSSLLFKNILCQEILRELNGLVKPQDHKVIDIWLLLLMYMNGEPIRRSIEKTFKKKIAEGCIQETMLEQCICGNKEIVQDYFGSFLSLAGYLLACKEERATAFGTHIYTCLFEEFDDNYSRQEILGALVTHVGSGVKCEVSSGLEIMTILATRFAKEMVTYSTHINGILDYLEGFSVGNLHKVYEVFSCLALSARTTADSFRSSIANELLMIVRKQVSHPDLKYKMMGIIGALKIVSSFGDAYGVTNSSPSQKESNCREALELLKTSLDSCKNLCLPQILFYDELVLILNHKTLLSEIMEWIGKHVGEFDSVFLSDLEDGKLPDKGSYCGLEGELWMNLDGDMSPICLNILPLASSLESTSLQILPSNLLLISTIERLTSQGSLVGIDALLGCPLNLPSSKYFSGAGWQSLTGKQKQILCLSLYYAANWMRELLNAFSTQVAEKPESISQATKKDIITKLLKRLRNLVFLESLLNNMIKSCPQSLPVMHPYLEQSEPPVLYQPNIKRNTCHDGSQSKKRMKKTSKGSTNTNVNEKLRQPTILNALKKAGAVISQKEQSEDSSILSTNNGTSESKDQYFSDSIEPLVEMSAVALALEAQRFKFRPLLSQCFSILTFPKRQDMCTSEHVAELSLYLYLLRDLHHKLDCLAPLGKQFSSRWLSAPAAAFNGVKADKFFSQMTELFPSLRTVLDMAICILTKGDKTSQQNSKDESAAAGNPNIPSVVLSESLASTLAFKEVLCCFSKILNLPAIQTDKSILSNLLKAFQPTEMSTVSFQEMQPLPSPDTTEYLYLGVCYFFEDIFNTACSFSVGLASESLLTLESVTVSVQRSLGKMAKENAKKRHSEFIQGLLPTVRSRLGTSAQKLLKQNWSDTSAENNSWKNKGEMVQKILRIYLETSESPSDLLEELACSILSQVPLPKSAREDDHHEFPSLCSATFIGWYRVLHEENLAILNKLVKAVCSEKQLAGKPEAVETWLKSIHTTVNVVVSLVNVCRTHDKVTIHAMAVKYGGKFVDSFLKVFDSLQNHFQGHGELIIQLVTDLQKATRTLQTLCSEAKGLKQTVITSKIPATKRSLERFLFHVKALLHTSSSGCTFWIGNLKHKDLTGQVVSSQAYVDNQKDGLDEDLAAAEVEEQPLHGADEETETQ